MVPYSPLDDPAQAQFAWARYRRLMKWMAGVSLSMVLAALVIIHRTSSQVSIHFYIATALAVGIAVMLMAALMGLVFLSSGTGHDAAIIAPPTPDDNLKP